MDGKNGALSGAVIRLAGPYDPSFTGLDISDCNFEFNSALHNGGAIFADCSDHQFDLRIQDVIFSHNMAKGDEGGALTLQNCSAALSFVSFEYNSAPFGGGGAVHVSLGSVTMTSVNAVGNIAGGPGGGHFE